MSHNKRVGLILAAVILLVVAGVIVFESRFSNESSKNSIEMSYIPENSPAASKLSKFEEELGPLVENGYLDSVTKGIVINAVQKYEADAKNNESLAGSLTLTVLKTKGYIGQEVFEKVKVAADDYRKAQKERKFQPLVASGLFADTTEAEAVYAVFIKKLGELTVAQKDTVLKEIETANPPLTEDEKKKRRDTFNADREKRIDDVLASMVSEQTINSAQADALRTFFASN